MSQAFSIPIISHDLTREESVIQIACTLENLDKTYNEIFSRIGASMERARDTMKKFESRLKFVDAKINKIKGSTKAIQICSSAKYPVNIENAEIPTQVDSSDPENFYDAIQFNEYKQKLNETSRTLFEKKENTTSKRRIHKYSSQYMPLDDLAFKDKFNEFSVDKVFKFNSTNIEKALSDVSSMQEGLGSVLNYRLESITSLLLFNSAQHPYKQSKMKDSLGDLDAKKSKKNLFEADASQNDIYEAPQSIIKGILSIFESFHSLSS